MADKKTSAYLDRLGVRPTLLDRAINYVSPVHGARRLRSRMAMAVVGGYHGGSKSRRALAEWGTTLSGSADADIVPDLAVLRDRSRDLIRNSPISSGALNTCVTAIFGGTGLVAQPRINNEVLQLDDEALTRWQNKTRMEFELWANNINCDIERSSQFPELQELVFRQIFENGEVFVLLPFLRRAGDAYGLKVQLIEADRIDNPLGKFDTKNLIAGITKDQYGAPTGYYVNQNHPGAIVPQANDHKLIPAFDENNRQNILHLFRRMRPGQSRGVPELAPVIESLKQLDRYTEAELMATVVSAMLTIFIESESGETGFAPMEPTSEIGGATTDDDIKLGNGAVVSLAAGEKVNSVNPNRPNSSFDPFVLSILRFVGASLGIPYEILIKQFNSSYSASRAAMLEAWRFFTMRRQWMARNFCQPFYTRWMDEAVTRGRIDAPGYLSGDQIIRRAYQGCEWVGPARGMIDEVKEVVAVEKRLRMGISTLEKEAAEITGTNYKDNLAQRKREIELEKDAGLGMDDPANSKSIVPPDKKIEDQS